MFMKCKPKMKHAQDLIFTDSLIFNIFKGILEGAW